VNAKIILGFITIAALAGYDSLGLDAKYLVYLLIFIAAFFVGAWFDSIGQDEEEE